MTASLRCPTCAAPLDPPGPHARAMKCPYCGANAVLTERLGTVEAVASRDAQTDAVAEVLRLLRAGRKVEAVKVYRERVGGGLKEARDAVERIAAGQPAGAIPSSARAGARAGLGLALVGLIVAVLVGVFALRQGGEAAPPSGAPTPAAPTLPVPGAAPEAPAFAREVLRFGREGVGAGRFTDARSVAVDGAGRVYVAEYGGGRVQVFDSLGRFQTQWIANPDMPLRDLDADREGTVYVVQSGRIRRYDGATGALRDEFRHPGGPTGYDALALALDGSLWAVTGDARLVHLSREGSVLETVDVRQSAGGAAHPARVAVSADGHLYALDRWSGEVYHFDPAGRFVDRFGGKGEGPDHLATPSDLVFDGRGRLYVSDLGRGIRVFDAGGHFLAAIGDGVVFGLAVTDRDALFAAYRNSHEVVKFRLPG